MVLQHIADHCLKQIRNYWQKDSNSKISADQRSALLFTELGVIAIVVSVVAQKIFECPNIFMTWDRVTIMIYCT